MRLPRCRLFLVTAVIAIAACGGGGGGSTVPPGNGPTAAPTPTPTASPSGASAKVVFTPLPAPSGGAINLAQPIAIGSPQPVLVQGQFGVQGVPDEVMSFLQLSNGTYNSWMTGDAHDVLGDGGFAFSTSDLLHLAPLAQAGPNAAYVIGNSGPGTETFDADYAGPGTVTVGSGPNLLMIYHGENHLFNGVDYPIVPFECTVGLATSPDNGVTWTKSGAIIAGEDPKPSGTPPSAGYGACNPAAVAVGGYIYVAYIEYPDPGTNHFGLAIARSPISADGAPGSWRKYYNGSYSTDALHGGAFTDVGPSAVEATQYMAFPEISFNRYLNAYVLLIVGNDGIYLATSSDLVHWSAGTRIINAPGPSNADVGTALVACVGTSKPCPKYAWYSTLMSPGENSSEMTDQTGYIYVAYDPGGAGQYEQLYRFSYAMGTGTVVRRSVRRR